VGPQTFKHTGHVQNTLASVDGFTLWWNAHYAKEATF